MNYSRTNGSGNFKSDDDIELARQALRLIAASRADDRDTWIKIGMALHATSPSLLIDWIAWSRQSSKFKDGECERQWRGFKPDKARSVGLGTLIRLAREDNGDHDFGRTAPNDPPPKSFGSLSEVTKYLEASTSMQYAATWAYCYADGKPAFWVARFDGRGLDAHGKRKKTFRPIRPAGERFEIGDPSGQLPLYRLQLLPRPGRVYLVEGEKPADAGADIGLETTTSAHGANAAAKSDWGPLAGCDVTILPDRDANGRRYAEDARRRLQALDPPAVVRVVELPGLPDGGDLFDFVKASRERGESPEQIRAAIEALAEAAHPSAGCEGDPQRGFQDFAEPVELPDTRPPVPAFDFGMLPESLAPWVKDIAERMQCAADFVFAATIVALSAVLGRRVGLRPKRLDAWLVIANLWGGVIGRPGILKSPAIQAAFAPLHRLEREAKDRFEQDAKAHKAAEILAQARRKRLERELNAAISKGGGGEGIAAELAADEIKPPTRRRYSMNDSTVEKAGELLNQNPNGLLSYRDELTGLLRSLDKEGQEGARSFYLQAWNGDSSYVYDRIGRGTIDIEAAILSVFGSIQPGPLEAYLMAGLQGGKSDDGLLQRFQILVFPDQSKEWTNHDREPDREAAESAMNVFRRLDLLEAEDVHAHCDAEDDKSIPYLRFSNGAQPLFDAWHERLERHLRSGDEDEAFESHLAKYRSLVPSLALIYHLADDGVGPVGVDALHRAIATAEYLEGHARRIYASALAPEMTAARALAAKLRAKAVKDLFTARDVYQNGWRGLADRAAVERAIGVLCDLDWITLVRNENTGGAPKNQYRINPRIWKTPPEATPTTGTTWSEGLAGVVQVPPEAPVPPNATTGASEEHASPLEPDGIDAEGEPVGTEPAQPPQEEAQKRPALWEDALDGSSPWEH